MKEGVEGESVRQRQRTLAMKSTSSAECVLGGLSTPLRMVCVGACPCGNSWPNCLLPPPSLPPPSLTATSFLPENKARKKREKFFGNNKEKRKLKSLQMVCVCVSVCGNCLYGTHTYTHTHRAHTHTHRAGTYASCSRVSVSNKFFLPQCCVCHGVCVRVYR